MSEAKWTWTRINVLDDGEIKMLPTQYVSMKTAAEERQKLRKGVRGWEVISEATGPRRTILAMCKDFSPEIKVTFVIYEKRKEA